MTTPDLIADPERTGHSDTGICVRAKRDGHWESVDIAELDRNSLNQWLRSRGGDNPWAERVVEMLLGHKPQEGAR